MRIPLLPGFANAAIVRALLLMAICAAVGYAASVFLLAGREAPLWAAYGVVLGTLVALETTRRRAITRHNEVGHLPTDAEVEIRKIIEAQKVRLHR